MPNGLLGNMKRHIRTKHPYVFHEEIKMMKPGDDDGDDDEVSEYVVEYLVDEGNTHNTRKSVDDDGESESEAENVDETPEVTGEFSLMESDPAFEEKVRFLCTKPVLGKSEYMITFYINSLRLIDLI